MTGRASRRRLGTRWHHRMESKVNIAASGLMLRMA
jgi:hypothetical protein